VLQSFDSEKEYRDARWVRVDLHLHSPGVPTFTLPAGLSTEKKDLEQIVNQYVQQLANQGIQIGAITDYQGVRTEWFDAIRTKAGEFGIVILPGTEVSLKVGKYGLHILAIFARHTPLERINQALTALDRNPAEPLIRDDGSHRDIDPRDNYKDAILRLKNQFDTPPLLIVAHPTNSNGLLKSLSPQEAAEFIRDVQPDAIEGPLSERDKRRLISTSILRRDQLERIAVVSFSDPKRIEDIGAKHRSDGSLRATYLKLSVLDDLRAIRLALRDHEILVGLGEKPEPAYTRLERVEVDGSGFLGNLRLALCPELNVLIGGRGVGKSALLEVIRYGVDLPEYSPTEYREGLVRYALGSGGKVTVYLRQVVEPGVERRYRVERVLGEEARVYELDASGEQLVELPVSDLLSDEGRPLFFGQRVLYKVAQSPTLRRQLLDDLVGRTARQKLREIEKLQQDLRRNARRLLELQEKRARREEVEGRLREIEHELRLFEQYGVAEKLREETALTRDEERLKRTEAIPQEFREEWQATEAQWLERLQGALADLSQAESQQRGLLQEDAAKVIRDLQDGLKEIFQQGTDLLHQATTGLDAVRSRWDAGRQALDEELRQIRQQLGAQALDPDRLLQLTREKEQLTQRLRLLQRAETQVQELEKRRQALLQQLRDARREAFRLRQERANEITQQVGQRVKVEVQYRGQRKEHAERLVEFFGGSRISKKDLVRIADNDGIADGMALAELARKGKEELMKETGLSEAQAQRLIDFLHQAEARFYELELLSPEDEVQVSLKVNDRWVPLEKLSAGQRATAMLLILLTQTQHPLIIDQPEDDLDNRFIYEDVVKLLRDQKGKRQLIAATHNPNIPVLAHAELIVALEAESEHARVKVQGGMDHSEVQNEVRRVMEGGDEAFRRRAEKYGWV